MQALRKELVAARPAGAKVPALSVLKLTIRFGARTILDAIDLDVREGEFLCVVGPSGSGKTTLLRVLAGLVLPAEGKVLFEGAEISAPSRDRAIIFQDYSKALLPWRTVRGNVALSLEARNVPASGQNAIIGELLAKMGLIRAKDQFPGQLSGGMQQRVQIARCLAQEPKLLLMDEPFGALDAMTRQALQDEILQLAAEKQITTIFITHDVSEAVYVADTVYVLSARPARILHRVNVPAFANREISLKSSAEFRAVERQLLDLLYAPA